MSPASTTTRPANVARATQEGSLPTFERAPARGGAFILGIGVLVAVALGVAIVLAGPKVAFLLLAVMTVVVGIALYPPLAAYFLIAVTPLVAGINRGAIIPVLRPNEGLLVIVAAGIALRLVVGIRTVRRPKLRLLRIDKAILLVAVTSSIIPLLWMALRGRRIEQDDVLYALMVWKYYGVFLIFRTSLKSEAQVRTCLWLSMGSAAIVSVLAIFEATHLFGVQRLLASYYVPYGNVNALSINRGGSTLALPIAVADLMTFNLAIAVGLLALKSKGRPILMALAFLFVMGVFGAGEFTGLMALLIALGTLGLATRKLRWLGVLVPALGVAGWELRSVIVTRLKGFQSASGFPPSWQGRLHNLQSYFWPQLFSGDNWILGVRVAARVSTQTMATGYIWIESGYTWLLWAGGVPLLGSFLYFLWTSARDNLGVARARADAVGVAALAAVTALVIIGVLMTFDPHLTYRGSADLLFALLGITAAGRLIPATRSRRS